MPDYVLKNKTKGVGPYVLSLPEGAGKAELDEALKAFAPGGWSLDTKTDPADVPSLPAEAPVVLPATTKEK